MEQEGEKSDWRAFVFFFYLIFYDTLTLDS